MALRIVRRTIGEDARYAFADSAPSRLLLARLENARNEQSAHDGGCVPPGTAKFACADERALQPQEFLLVFGRQTCVRLLFLIREFSHLRSLSLRGRLFC